MLCDIIGFLCWFNPKGVSLHSRQGLLPGINKDVKKRPQALLKEGVRSLADIFEAAHIRAQHFRDLDTAISLLIVFHQRHQGTTYCQA